MRRLLFVAAVMLLWVGMFAQTGTQGTDGPRKLTASDLRAMLSDANKISDPINRDDVKTRIRKLWSEERALQEADYLDTLRGATDVWYENNGDYKKIPSQTWDKLREVDRFQFKHALLGKEVLSPAREPRQDWRSY
jgi:hypothetical protein